jgi:hypothetical protein
MEEGGDSKRNLILWTLATVASTHSTVGGLGHHVVWRLEEGSRRPTKMEEKR